jgi:8-amino-7-oxononanoate synthase
MPNVAWLDELTKDLDDRRGKSLFRDLKVVTSAPGPVVEIDGCSLINFASNNYLGLAGDPRVRAAAVAAVDRWGAGATASRLLGGTLELHQALERALADYKGTDACRVFPSGWHANTGALPAIVGPDDTIYLDRLAHASLVDGARLSRARLRVFRHNDPEDLARALRRSTGRAWVVTESVFSMDGDVAPLRDLSDVCGRAGAQLYVDEAHATGVWGPEGRGVVNEAGLEKTVAACMGTLSKGLGALGGFVAGATPLAETLQNRSRAFIYSTALDPAAAAAALAAVTIARAEPERRERVFARAERLRRALGIDGRGPIVPLVVGEESAALDLAAFLRTAGVYAPAVRPPTVPKGTARVRFSITADHTDADIDQAADAVTRWRRRAHTLEA